MLNGARTNKMNVIAAKHCKRVRFKSKVLITNVAIESATVIP